MEVSSVQKPSFFILFFLISFASLSAVFYTPALPAMTRFFHVTNAQTQLTLVLYLVGFALGQLSYGPLSNRYGRKPVLYFGLIIAIVSSLLCALSAVWHQFWLLLVFRFFQAVGSCVGMMMSFTIVTDYHKKGVARITALLILSFALLPPFGTMIGGFIVQHINWQTCFYFLTFYGIFLLLLSFRLPETCLNVDHHALKLGNLIRGYLAQFKHRQFMLLAITMGFASSFIYLFAAESPFIGLHIIKLTPSVYGVWIWLTYLGMMAGSLLSAYLSPRFKLMRLVRIGISMMFLFSVLMWIAFMLGWINVFSLFFPMAINFLFEIFVFSNSATLATMISENKSNASAVMNFFNVGIPMVMVQLLSMVHGIHPAMMPFVLTLIMAFLIVLSFFLRVEH